LREDGDVVTDSTESLAADFARIARHLQAQATPDTTQRAITGTATAIVAGCEHAAISIIRRRGGVHTVASTSEVPVWVDGLQYELEEGPCLDALSEQRSYLVDDLAVDERWPRFGRRAVLEVGVRSMMSFRLFVEDDTIGALNLYSERVAAFDEHAHLIGSVLGAHAAIAVNAAREHERADQLDEALDASRRIGMAIGILMGTRRITEPQAFDALRRSSRSLNVKLRDIARHVVDTGELPLRGDVYP
jgi:transcriptional regulator with GAF, ATPase, and Fis domain